MVAVARGAALGASNPLLAEWIAVFGVLAEPVSLSWSIYDISTVAKEDAPVLVAGPTAVDLDDDKVSTGRYAVAWTVPSDEVLGRHEVRWSAVLVDGGPTITWRREFEVTSAAGLDVGTRYALIADLRDEGIAAGAISDAKLARRIAEASRIIEQWTGRFFEPRAARHRFDGTGTPSLLFDEPIIAVDTVSFYGTEIDGPLRVYNRHLAGLLQPDDRNTPKLERIADVEPTVTASAVFPPDPTQYVAPPWPYGRQNIEVVGVWGYTERDGSPSGRTPELIRRATVLLTIRNLPKLADTEANAETRNRHRIVSERTREQSYQLGGAQGERGAGAIIGDFTGDPEIDQLLETFNRPPFVGSAS